MGEIKAKLNIKKITVKNFFVLVLLMAIIAMIGAISKLIGSGASKTNTAQAQGSCWVPPWVPPAGGESCSSGENCECAGESG